MRRARKFTKKALEAVVYDLSTQFTNRGPYLIIYRDGQILIRHAIPFLRFSTFEFALIPRNWNYSIRLDSKNNIYYLEFMGGFDD